MTGWQSSKPSSSSSSQSSSTASLRASSQSKSILSSSGFGTAIFWLIVTFPSQIPNALIRLLNSSFSSSPTISTSPLESKVRNALTEETLQKTFIEISNLFFEAHTTNYIITRNNVILSITLQWRRSTGNTVPSAPSQGRERPLKLAKVRSMPRFHLGKPEERPGGSPRPKNWPPPTTGEPGGSGVAPASPW